VTVVVGVTNQGPGLATSPNYPWLDYFLLSTNPVPDVSATTVLEAAETGPVPAGATYWRTNSLALPLVASGDYFLIFSANGNQAIPETHFANNTLAVPVSFHLTPPDLAPYPFRLRLWWTAAQSGGHTRLGRHQPRPKAGPTV